jgi:hypothetical protein
MLVTATRNTFGSSYPVQTLQTILVSIEYPRLRTDYPSFWVNFETTTELSSLGIESETYTIANSKLQTIIGWQFQGFATWTIVALTSLQRDMLFDELVRVMAFGSLDPERSAFRKGIETNPFIGARAQWNKVGVRGFTEAPGTPWGTAEIIYEATIYLSMVGELYSTPATGTLVELTKVTVTPTIETA